MDLIEETNIKELECLVMESQSSFPLSEGDVIAVYGTLRKDQGNYYGTGLNMDAEYLETVRLIGFKMCSLGGFPGVKYEDNLSSSIVVELYRLKNPQVGRRVDNLEGYEYSSEHNTFYKRHTVLTLRDGVFQDELEIYLYQGSFSEEIVGGDWLEYLKRDSY